MTSYQFKTNFGIRVKQNIAEKLHSFVELRGGNRNALVNEAIAEFLENQVNKEVSEAV